MLLSRAATSNASPLVWDLAASGDDESSDIVLVGLGIGLACRLGGASSFKDGRSGDDERALVAEDKKSILRFTGSGVKPSSPESARSPGEEVIEAAWGERFFLRDGRSPCFSLLVGVLRRVFACPTSRGIVTLAIRPSSGSLWLSAWRDCVCFRETGADWRGGDEGGVNLKARFVTSSFGGLLF